MKLKIAIVSLLLLTSSGCVVVGGYSSGRGFWLWPGYRVSADRAVPACPNVFQTTRVRASLEDCGLRADGQEVPTLKGIDRFVRHQSHVRSLEVERFGPAPVESYDRIERSRHGRR